MPEDIALEEVMAIKVDTSPDAVGTAEEVLLPIGNSAPLLVTTCAVVEDALAIVPEVVVSSPVASIEVVLDRMLDGGTAESVFDALKSELDDIGEPELVVVGRAELERVEVDAAAEVLMIEVEPELKIVETEEAIALDDAATLDDDVASDD